MSLQNPISTLNNSTVSSRTKKSTILRGGKRSRLRAFYDYSLIKSNNKSDLKICKFISYSKESDEFTIKPVGTLPHQQVRGALMQKRLGGFVLTEKLFFREFLDNLLFIVRSIDVTWETLNDLHRLSEAEFTIGFFQNILKQSQRVL